MLMHALYVNSVHEHAWGMHVTITLPAHGIMHFTTLNMHETA